jgi:serine/threonine-protein kinase
MADQFIQTARRIAGGAFDILGELGRAGGERIAYLAREGRAGDLVALTLEGLESAAKRGNDPSFAVRRTLDSHVPASGLRCPACNSETPTWARYCSFCNHDLSGGPPPVSDQTTGRMLAQTAARGRFELLGDMERSEGGSPVYFGRDPTTAELVALRLEPKDDPDAPVPFTLSVTQRITAVAAAASQTGAGRVLVCPTCGAQYPGGTFFCPRDGTALRPKTKGQDLVGRTVAGRYRIVQRLGQGGMGQVYRAEHVRMGSSCAIKIMNPALEQDPEAMGRFAREATHASRIDHPNVARVHDFGETEDGLLFIAMEFVEGETLSAILEREGAMEAARAAGIAWQVADALSAAHSLGTVHRDIKPDNIIVKRQADGTELAKIVDFGIARAIEVAESEQVTRAGFVVGNPKYMSPEQLTGEPVDARTDLYSLGCVLYELLAGRSAFSATSGPAMLTKRLTEPPPSPRERQPRVPPALDAIVIRAMARDPAARFGSAVELRDALARVSETVTTGRRRIQTGGSRKAEETAAGPAPAAVEPAPAHRRRLWPISLVPLAGLVALFVIVVFQLARSEPEPAPGTVEIGGALPAGSVITARDAQGQSVAVTEASIALAPGTWEFVFEAPGHESDRATVTVEDGGRQTWTPRVVPLPVAATTGVIRIAGDLPPGASLTARNAAGVERRIEGGRIELEAGAWRLAFRAPGFEEDEGSIMLAEGGSETWTPRLRREPQPPSNPIQPPAVLTGTVRIGGTLPAGAAITARGPDGTVRSVAGRSIDVGAGAWTFEATAPGHAADRTTLRVSAGGTQTWTPRLRAEPEPPRLRPASIDSVSALLAAVQVRAERREYPLAFEVLRTARTRVDALLAAFPAEASLRSLDQRVSDEQASVRTACEAWREIQVQRGLPAPACR